MAKQDSQNTKASVFKLNIRKTPFDSPTEHFVELGFSVSDIKHAAKGYAEVLVNNQLVDDQYIPNSSDNVEVIITPQADPLSIAISVAISLAVGYYSYRQALKAAQRNQPDDVKFNRLSGIKNDDGLYKPHPLVLGKRKVAPRYIARPYTIVGGDDEFFYGLFSAGYGPLKLENLRIGDVPLSEFEHEVAILDHYENLDEQAISKMWRSDISQTNIEIALEANADWTFSQSQPFAERIVSDFFMPAGLLRTTSKGKRRLEHVCIRQDYFNEATQEWIAVGRVRGDFVSTQNLAIQPVTGTIFFIDGTARIFTSSPQGTVNVNNSGAIASVSEILPYSYTRDAAGHYIFVQGVPESYRITAGFKSSTQQKPLFFSITVDTSQDEPLQLRTKKIFPNETEAEDRNSVTTVTWTNLKTFRALPSEDLEEALGGNRPLLRYDENGVQQTVRTFRPTVIALRIKATGQLAGNLDNFFVDATMCVPTDKTADWRNWPNLTLEPSVNPADAYKWLLQGPSNFSPIPISKIDDDILGDWRTRCLPENDNWRISAWIDYEATLQANLINTAFVGRAEFSFKDGKYGVVEKIRKDTPVQMFTPRNMAEFQSTREYPEDDDGIKFTFDSAEFDYEKDEGVFFDPIKSADVTKQRGRFRGTEFWGVDNFDQAYRLARFEYYESFLQREIYSFKANLEILRCSRGDVVILQNDTILVGLGAGRVKSVNGSTVVIDEQVNLDTATGQLGLQFRDKTGSFFTTLATYNGDGEWTCNTIVPEVEAGDLVVYGEAGKEALDAIITDIRYNEDMTANVTAVNVANEVFDRDDDFIPEYVSNITERPDNSVPETPFITGLYANTTTGIITLTISQPVAAIESGYSVLIQAREVNDDGTPLDETNEGWSYVANGSAIQTSYSFPDLTRGVTYEFRVQFRGGVNAYSLWSEARSVLIPYGEALPLITQFFADYRKDGTYLRYTRIEHPEFKSYEIRTDTNFGDNTTGFVAETSDSEFFIGAKNTVIDYYIATENIYGEYGNIVQSQIEPPVQVELLEFSFLKNQFFGITLNWISPQSAYEIKGFELRYNPPSELVRTIENSTPLTFTDSNTYTHNIFEEGDYKYYLRSVDIGGNYSAWVSNETNYTQPSNLIVDLDDAREELEGLGNRQFALPDINSMLEEISQDIQEVFERREDVDNEENKRKQAFSELSVEIDNVSSATNTRIDEVEVDVLGNASAISGLNLEVGNLQTDLGAEITRLDSVEITANDTATALSVVQGQVNDPANNTSALYGFVQQAQLDIEGNTSSITALGNRVESNEDFAQAQVILNSGYDADLDKLSARAFLGVDVNGRVTGINIEDAQGDPQESRIDFQANSFAFLDPNGNVKISFDTNTQRYLFEGTLVAADGLFTGTLGANIVKANNMDVGTLSAIAVEMGTLTGGTINLQGKDDQLGNYVALNDAQSYIDAGSTSGRVFRVAKDGSSFINGRSLGTGSILGRAFSQDAIDFIAEAIGSATPETGGVRSITETIATATFNTPSFESSGIGVNLQFEFGGQFANPLICGMYSELNPPPTPTVQVVLRRGGTTIHTQTFSGSVVLSGLEHPDPNCNYWEIELPAISINTNEASSPTGEIFYTTDITVTNWDALSYGALVSEFTYRTSQTASGAVVVTWGTLNGKPFESLDTNDFEVDTNGVLSVIGNNGATNLSVTRTATSVTVNSSTGDNATIAAASTTDAGVMTTANFDKLAGIAAGAQVNTVTSVAGKTGAVSLTASDVGAATASHTHSGADITTGTVADARIAATLVRTSRTLTAGDGLTGGGDLGGNRAFAVDASVVRTSGDQMIADAKTFANPIEIRSQVNYNAHGGGWARGLTYSTAAGSRIAGFMGTGSSDNATLLCMAHGANPWSSGTGLYVLANGSVGIGTTSPNSLLEISGSVGSTRVSNAGNALLFTRNSVNYVSAVGGASSSLAFVTGGTSGNDPTTPTRVIIDSSGNMGVGTTSPAVKVHVVESGEGTNHAMVLSHGRSVASTIDTARLTLGLAVNRGGYIEAVRQAANTNGHLLEFGTSSGNNDPIRRFQIGISSSTFYTALSIQNTSRIAGSFYSGAVANPVNNNRMNYDGYLHATRFYTPSSRRLKNIERVVSLDESLQKVVAIGSKGVSLGKYKQSNEKRNTRWLIAEDVQLEMDEAVSYDDKGRVSSLNYDQLVPDLYAAIAAQQKMIDELRGAVRCFT